MAAEAPAAEPAPRKKSGLLTIIKAVAFISAIVLMEIVGASFVLPSAKDVEAVGAQLASDAAHEEEHAEENDEHGHSATGEDSREVSLGSFHVLTYDPQTGTAINIDFDLVGTVLSAEEPEFTHLFELNENRISEQVTMTMRGMETADFTDADLDLIKRKLLEKANRALGKPLLREIVIPKFSFIER